jgi:2-isopropylmalate synthase
MARRIFVYDTTLRDAEQAPGGALGTDGKLRVARALAALGVDAIEVDPGSFSATRGDFAAAQAIAAEIAGPAIVGLAQGFEDRLDLCWRAVRAARSARIAVIVPTSDHRLRAHWRTDRAGGLKLAQELVRKIRAWGAEAVYVAEDCTRTETAALAEFVQAAVEAGATWIILPDTYGRALPWEYATLVTRVMDEVPGAAQRARFSTHCHNDLGLATANSLAGVMAGAREVQGTLTGMGARAGNAALEELAVALHARRDRGDWETGLDLSRLYETTMLYRRLAGFPLAPNKPVVGQNVFHEAEGSIDPDGFVFRPADIGYTGA